MSGWLPWAVVIVLVLAALFWPALGLLPRLRRRAAARRRERDDNVLKHLLHEAQAGRAGTFASVQGTLLVGDRRVLRTIGRLRAATLIASDGGIFHLTEAGEQRARHLVRAHRLLERYLVDEARLPVTAVHRVAERLEHRLSEADADRLSASLGHPERDPHGDPIPSAGESSTDAGAPITACRVGDEGRIVHLEDEPTATYSRLVQLGLQPGQVFRVDDADEDALDLLVEGRQVRLPLELAGNVFAAPLEGAPSPANGLVRLSDLPNDAVAEIASLSPACQGFTRRRLLDLGFTPGTRVQPVLATFVGDPRAYRVRGTTIALRRDQASSLIVRTPAEAGAESRP
jgi:DtxR family Mn-dependent transcriptional regulator